METNELRRRPATEAIVSADRPLFYAMAETLTDIVFTALPDGSWDFANGRIYEITGLAGGAALGSGWINALHPDDVERVTRGLNEAIVSEALFETSFRLRTHQGIYRRFVAKAHPVHDDSGRIVRWVGTATDVDDHLAAEDALVQAIQQHRDFLAKFTHDLRNLIAPIAYAAAILKLPAADAAQRQGAIAAIDAQVRELRDFLDGIRAGDKQAVTEV